MKTRTVMLDLGESSHLVFKDVDPETITLGDLIKDAYRMGEVQERHVKDIGPEKTIDWTPRFKVVVYLPEDDK